MHARHLFFSALLLIAGIVSIQWLIAWLRPTPPPATVIGPQRSGYTLSTVTLWSYSKAGYLSSKVTAPSLSRREGDRSYYVDQPDFVLFSKEKPNQPPWKGHAVYGWISGDNHLIKLNGDVHMHRHAFGTTPAAQINTSEVTLWPNKNRLETQQFATIQQGTSKMSSIGLRANLNTHYMEMLNDFHGHFEPDTKK